MKEAMKRARQIIWRYRHETPLGNQPHMIAIDADEAFELIDAALAQPAPVQGWKLVPVEPTAEMWKAVNKLDDECASGNYNGKGCSIEQAWNCLLEAAPQPAQQEPKFWYDEEEGLLHDHFNDLPLGCIPLYTTPPQRTEERNFCPRCGKRTADLTVIHTCTPPQPEQEPVAWATRMGEYAHIHWGAKRPEYPMVYEAPLYTTPPQRKPLTDEQKDILNFLFGLRAIDDVWFGDKHPTERGQYWWRNRLRKAFQEAAHSIKEKNT